MPELLVDFITSLDGYAAAEGWPGWWGLAGPEYLTWLGEQPEADFTVLMGATTYRGMSRFAAENEPGTDALAGMSKVVFSTTVSEPLAWANTQLVARDAVEAVREMKAEGSKSMRTIGSLTLCRSLLTAGLVDRFRVVVFPVITGSSGRETCDLPDTARLGLRLARPLLVLALAPRTAPLAARAVRVRAVVLLAGSGLAAARGSVAAPRRTHVQSSPSATRAARAPTTSTENGSGTSSNESGC